MTCLNLHNHKILWTDSDGGLVLTVRHSGVALMPSSNGWVADRGLFLLDGAVCIRVGDGLKRNCPSLKDAVLRQ